MQRLFFIFLFALLSPVVGLAQVTPPPESTAAQPTGPDLATQAVAAQAMQQQNPDETHDMVDYVVDSALELFDVRSSGNTTIHYAIATVFLVIAILLRRAVTAILFGRLKRLAARTKTTLDDKLIPAMEGPCATFIVVFGLFAALKVLKVPPQFDEAIGYGSTVAFSLVIFWGLLRAFGAVLDHAYEITLHRGMGIAAFMPWIKKTLITVVAVIGVLMVVQSLGYDVRALLAGLGIGGLAFALAAQDTIANVFGSVVVAIDQPFKTGDYVKIGGFEGTVEDIGLRSTRLRPIVGNLIILPNKMVAAEGITNMSRFSRRRVDQVIGLTYGTSADKMAAIVAEIRRIIESDEAVDPTSVHTYFRDYNSSSLDIWVAYNTREPDFPKFMTTRQRINLAIMRAVEALGLEFAYPTQTIHLEGEIARQLAAGRATDKTDSPPQLPR